MMELHVHNMTMDGKQTCGFMPMLNYFSFNNDN